jgi:hypothetical protein
MNPEILRKVEEFCKITGRGTCGSEEISSNSENGQFLADLRRISRKVM